MPAGRQAADTVGGSKALGSSSTWELGLGKGGQIQKTCGGLQRSITNIHAGGPSQIMAN